jgi:hypothetical protein
MQNRVYDKISPYLQERMVYLGQYTNYEESVSLLKRFYGIEISKTQQFRVTNHYGEQIAATLEKEQESRQTEKLSSDTVVYAECDGSMILTGEKKEDKSLGGCWEEVKLLRLYKSCHKLESLNRGIIEKSEYAAHLGSHRDFEAKAERLVNKYENSGKNLVFISDGASWIHKWQTAMYPKATQILDYYHACEHLAEFVKIAIPDETERKIWFDRRKKELSESRLKQVLKQIGKISQKGNKTIKREADKLSNYYIINKYRMDYKTYLLRNLQIGSGAIEAAHRNVIQKRMKQSGQRWSRKGAQYMLNLRTCYMSGNWNSVIGIIRNNAA